MAEGKDYWGSSMGVVLAVAGSAVGLGNFLKFPGQVATYGGAAFMLVYVASFLLLGLPFAMMEWTAGREIGDKFHSVPWTFRSFFRHPSVSVFAAISVVIPFVICSYYTYMEAWCLGYATNFLAGTLDFKSIDDSAKFFSDFVGKEENGSAIGFSLTKVGGYFFLVFAANFYLIYKGISKGIEKFCKIAMPLLIFIALVLVVRVITITPPPESHSSINQGMGFMWNATQVVLQENVLQEDGTKEWRDVKRLVGDADIQEAKAQVEKNPQMRVLEIPLLKQLLNPSIWIAAIAQIFYSMSVGMGIIISYSSYLRKKDDVVLSALTSASANEFCEVCLGGMITVPAAVAFLGVSGVLGSCASLFDLGFNVLPMVFLQMPLGSLIGFLFFFLLFLAAITSTISILQPSLAFFQEILGITKKPTVLLLMVLMLLMSMYSVYFSKDLMALDSLDFWVGQTLLFVVATYEVLMFAWHYGAERLVKKANRNSLLKLPKCYAFLWKWITPSILISVFLAWLAKDVFGLWGGNTSEHIEKLFRTKDFIEWMSVILIALLCIIFGVMIAMSKHYKEIEETEED